MTFFCSLPGKLAALQNCFLKAVTVTASKKLRAGVDRSVTENLSKSVPLAAHAGSFNCVRLSPHFAQDDRFGEGRAVNMAKGETTTCELRP